MGTCTVLNLQTWLTPTCTNLHLVFEEEATFLPRLVPPLSRIPAQSTPLTCIVLSPVPIASLRSYTCSDLSSLKILFSWLPQSHLLSSFTNFFREWSGLIVSLSHLPLISLPTPPPSANFSLLSGLPAWSSNVDLTEPLLLLGLWPFKRKPTCHKKQPFFHIYLHTGIQPPDPNPSWGSKVPPSLLVPCDLACHLTSIVKWD